ATLMRGVVLLPDYLERLQGGHKDVPVVLLPLLNDLRAAHGEQAVDESALFSPGMQRPLPDAFGAGMPQPAEGDAASLVAQFDAALAAWPSQSAALAAAAEGLYARAGNAEGARRMYWVASAVAAALRDGALQADEGLREAFAAVAAEARRQP